MIVFLFASAVLAQSPVSQLTSVQRSTGQTYLVRFETAVSPVGAATFNTDALGGQVTTGNMGSLPATTIFFRDVSSANSVVSPATPFGTTLPTTGFTSDFADSYTVVSVLAGGGQTVQLELCLNNTVLFSFLTGSALCTPVLLTPIGAGGFVNRNTVTLTQNFASPVTSGCSLTTGSVVGSCTVALAPASFSFALTVVDEEVSTVRDCNIEPVFGRGTLDCPVLLGRTLTTGETAFVNSIGGSGSVLTNSSLASSSLTTPLFNVPRNGGLEFASLGSGNLAGGAVGDQARAIEAFFTPTSVATASFDTFYVAVINVAHLETSSTVNSVTTFNTVSPTATVVIEDSLGRVLQYQLTVLQESAGEPLDSRFVELYVTETPMTITVQAVPEALGFNNNAFNGSLAAGSVPISTLSGFTVQPNGYYVVALSTSFGSGFPSANQYHVQIFDVTPVEGGILQGTQEQQIINLIEPNFELELFQLTNTGSATSCSTVATVNSDSSTIFNGSFSNIAAAPFGSSCPAPTAFLSNLNIAGTLPGNTGCGRHVTVFFGRTYSVNSPACTVTGPTTCASSTVTTNQIVGDLSFAGSTFTSLQNAAPQPLTFTIGACNCTAVAAAPPCDSCSTAILTAITGSSGSVSGSVSGLSGSINSVLSSVGGLAGTLAAMEQRLVRLNNTVQSVKKIDTKIEKLIKHKC
jgi:hypothetical protein